RLEQQRDFWKAEFAEEVDVLELPIDHSRPMEKSYDGGNRVFLLSKELTDKLQDAGESSGATMFMTVLSIFNILLSKLSNQEDITIGTPVAGRDHADLEDVIGMFVNTLVLRNYPEGNKTFREFLSEVKEKTLNCFENQAYQYEELIEELSLPRDTSRNALFDVMLMYQNFEEEELVIPDLKLEGYESGYNVTKFDLTLMVRKSEDGLYLNFGYATDLFERATIDRFITYFERIV
ncbi:condensation domain-containing protein, partial [Fulvivirga imtechensis]|uniref:condensation domain-containing protein n=1 Tax=Fulvivirga imtechensis TaxID=881893 RepID=UPI00058D775C